MLKRILSFLKSTLRFIGNLIAGILILIVFYLLAALVGTVIPANSFVNQPAKGIDIYIKSNGVHTDLIVPMANRYYDWREKIFLENFLPDTSEQMWAALGWGDKGFYLYTPEWSDLTVSTAVNAMFLPSPTAMHVTLYKEKQIRENKLTKKITISEEQYLILCEYVYNSFQKDTEENFILIPSYHYKNMDDNFYEANGSYHLFNTCNNWTNSALKAAGVRTALWAPFDKCIFYHF